MTMDKLLFWQLIEMEHERARMYCGRLAGDFAIGDDLYQDSVVRAFNGFKGLKEVGAFRPWFYKIINNAYKSRFRSLWWRRIIHKSSPLDDNILQHNPANLYDARRRLEYALSALGPDDRAIVTLAELEGWKLAEIAELLSVKEGSVKMRLSRARRKMRERLGKLYQSNFEQIKNQGMTEICCVAKPEKD
jgi:RNA polymerase sigma-70 factor (ECF subfamily)